MYKRQGYTRRVVWLDKEGYRPIKVLFYDRKNSLLKTLSNSDYQQYLGHYWRPGVMEMQNHQTGKSTTLDWTNYQFQVGLNDGDFNKARLKNIR